MFDRDTQDRKIGILTLPGSFNYGNRLQAYATAAIWHKLGYDSEELIFKWPVNPFAHPLGAFRNLTQGTASVYKEPQTTARTDAFRQFCKEVPIRRIESLTEASLAQLAYISVGSDQVWNPAYAGITAGGLKGLYHAIVNRNAEQSAADWYFLRFARPEQRIALAPSIGLDELTSRQAGWLARGVSGFPRLSVREQRGAELIKECSGLDAEVICDPTLVLTAEEWRAAADERLTPADPYVFTYLLGGTGAEAQNVLGKVTENGRIPVVPLSDRQKPGEPDAGPAEFISLIDNAEHVVTDSFHAAVFSSILQTPLTIVRREGGASMFSRLESLAKTLGIEHKVYDSPAYDPSRAGDYATVPGAIEREREKFMAYLRGCLND